MKQPSEVKHCPECKDKFLGSFVPLELVRRKIQEPKAPGKEMTSKDGKTELVVVKKMQQTRDPEEIDSGLVPPRPWRSSTKINALMAQLALIIEDTDEKVLVFSQFTTMLDLVEEPLKLAQYPLVRYDGTMSAQEKDVALDTFRNNPKHRILLMSLKCGSLGLNLTVASRVMMLDPWWNPAVEDQAVDRAHRHGQQHPVKVLRYTITGSVEDRILALQDGKRKLADAALGEGGLTQMARLTLNDLVYLFKGGELKTGDNDDEDL